ncbi:hypothetical protein ASPZODRAFT_65988 [Penicilliopsis zonata CBS 506.65]|uniref:D-isomer specific 2-hydroxyacid dehydrogenase NAD-binding domain-containing protein n=1 Tax=Penicilliopsis zonata CBS 506.65 TaxID=1073090 RepID=A0A1L9SHX2_9EURO|nr:hypothetical protein ASPZODRAFT_65988 [Penicilliopsis zonata CBS 506.65]OJJ46809.1 hypothetical protein ASPZODRAFT_65988 [Penicilliopsis zonata CBS 506.65]
MSVFLILIHFTPPAEWLDMIRQTYPDLRVEVHLTDMYSLELPAIAAETWAETTVLFTWKLFPTKEMAPKLQYVQLLSAGAGQIMGLPVFESTEIAFCTSNGVHPPQIAEWVFSTFLAFQHHIPEYLDNQRESKWIDPVTDEDTEDAVGLRVGIMGYGCVGRQVAHVARAFGMNIHAYTLHERATAESRKSDAYTEAGLGDPEGVLPARWFSGKEQLDEFLASDLDLLVITLPLTKETDKMLGPEQFALLSKKKTYVSNVGRGGVIDTDALVAALDQDLIRGAALDVTEPEPLPEDHRLWKFKNVIITPHCAGNSNHYYERVLKILAYNLQRRAEGKPVVNQVSRSLGY